MPAPPGPTTAKCDLIYGIVKAGREDLEVRLENNLLILKTRGSLWDGGTGEKGEISIILPEECKKGVVYKPKADHYFTCLLYTSGNFIDTSLLTEIDQDFPVRIIHANTSENKTLQISRGHIKVFYHYIMQGQYRKVL